MRVSVARNDDAVTCGQDVCLFDVDNCGQDVSTIFVCLMLTNVVKMLALISFPLMYDGVHFVRILTMIQ